MTEYLKSKANLNALKKSSIILRSMVNRNIKNQYRNSVLGILWTVLNPLLNMIVMALVFSNVFGRTTGNVDYSVYVLAGNTVFSLLRISTMGALPSIVNNYDMLTKTRISHNIFPVSHVLSATVNFFFSLLALIIVMLIRMANGVKFYWTMFMIIIPFLPSLMLFSAGISYVLSALYVHFRDIKHFYTVFLTLWTYLTPLFYSPTILSEKMQKVMKFNPMFHYVQYFRDVVQYGVIPSWQQHLILYGMGIGMYLIGLLIFNKLKRNFILYI